MSDSTIAPGSVAPAGELTGPVPASAATPRATAAALLGVHPRRMPLVLRVGVTGHHASDLDRADIDLLGEQVRAALRQVSGTAGEIQATGSAAFAPEPPTLRVISSLSEGAERLVAQAGLALGYALECPLPFDRDCYEQESTDSVSRAEFRALLQQAQAVVELDGSNDTPAETQASFHAVNRIVLAHCDVLIAIWDGDESVSGGRPARLVAQARQAAIPIIWIQATPPHDARLLIEDGSGIERPREQLDGLECLTDALAPLLLPPVEEDADKLHAYFAETYPSWSVLGRIWPFFHDLLGRNRLRRPRLRGITPAAADEQWQQDWETRPRLPQAVTGQIDRDVEPHFLWADTLASHYVSMYRSSFIVIGLLAVLAVLMGVIGDGTGLAEHFEWFETFRRLAAIGVLLAIMLLWRLGTRYRWHERGIDYRFLAEELRQLRYLAPLGRVPAFSRPRAHDAADDPDKTWMGWQARAITRATSLINAQMSPGYLESCHALLRDGLVGGQAAYHAAAAHRYERFEHRLHMMGFLTFVGTLAVLLATFVIHFPGVLILEVVLPALGASLAAIRSQGELERLAKRSDAMGQFLEGLKAQLAPPEVGTSSAQLAEIAEMATEALAAEVSDWRIVFQSKPLELPG